MAKKKAIRRGSLAVDILIYAFFVVFCLLIIYPFWDTIVLSFADPTKTSSLGTHLWNKVWSLSSYKYVIEEGRLLTAYVNTVIRTVVTTVGALVMTMLAAYPMSKKDLPYRNVFTFFFLFTMYFGGGLIPTYLLMRDIHLLNTRWVLIIPGMFGVYNMIIMRNYLMSIDKALEESAFIEGANYITVLVKIIVPLSKPVIATIALWVAVGNWNAWYDCMIYIRDPKLVVLQQLLRDLVTQQDSGNATSMAYFNDLADKPISTPTVRAATILLTIGPIVIIYPFIQKYFVKGIMIGSLKG